MKYLILLHIMNYKRQCAVHNYIKKVTNVSDYICSVSLVNIHTDWKVCNMMTTIMCNFCLYAILYGCVSPHLSDIQCKCAPFVKMFICYICVSCCWYIKQMQKAGLLCLTCAFRHVDMAGQTYMLFIHLVLTGAFRPAGLVLNAYIIVIVPIIHATYV